MGAEPDTELGVRKNIQSHAKVISEVYILTLTQSGIMHHFQSHIEKPYIIHVSVGGNTDMLYNSCPLPVSVGGRTDIPDH